MIASLLPPAVAVVTAAPGEAVAPLFPDEALLVAGAVTSRRIEFAAGRTCARDALRALGRPDVAILADDRRAPQWPADVVGSITHCAGFTAAAVALRRDVAALGIDVERTGELDEIELIATDGERRAARRALGADADRLLFSAKESTYKAWYPATHRWLDFTDVTVEIRLDGTFDVRPGDHLGTEDRAFLAALCGRYAVDAEHVFTAVHVPAQGP